MRCQRTRIVITMSLAMLVVFFACLPALGGEGAPTGLTGEGTAAAPEEGQTAAETHVLTEKELAKASQNPIADMISLPLRNTTNFGAGPDHNKRQNLFTIAPIIPIKLTGKWNIITRTVIPLLYQPSLAPGTGSDFGMSDINVTAFVARAESRKLLWGLGPTLFMSTATGPTLGTGKWSAGPSIAMVAQPGDWVAGFLLYNVWSFAGYGDRPGVNQLLLQTLINYNLPKGWYLTTTPFLSANWKKPNDDRWLVPVGGGFGKIVRTKRTTLDLQAQAFWFAQRPRSEATWTLLLQLKFLFPGTLGMSGPVAAGGDAPRASEVAAQN